MMLCSLLFEVLLLNDDSVVVMMCWCSCDVASTTLGSCVLYLSVGFTKVTVGISLEVVVYPRVVVDEE